MANYAFGSFIPLNYKDEKPDETSEVNENDEMNEASKRTNPLHSDDAGPTQDEKGHGDEQMNPQVKSAYSASSPA